VVSGAVAPDDSTGVRELTIAAVEVEAVSGPAGRFPYPVLWQVVPLDVYLSPGERAEAPPGR
jgi:hypothetical protein